jgi:nitrite reductase/ring-hydroxylating ferredoxin subunit
VGVLVGDDAWVARRLADVGGDRTIRWVDLATAEGLGVAPSVVVVELVDDAAVAVASRARGRWPDSLVAGYLAEPDQARWLRAQRAGCDLVANRGALVPRLRSALAGAKRPPRQFPLLPEADVAGRLGLVGRVSETPVGPAAVYQVEGRLSAVADTCPHAGAALSEGELDGCVVTCPRHGSQFDVRTGERVRGPADDDLAVHRVRLAEGQVVLLLEEEGP